MAFRPRKFIFLLVVFLFCFLLTTSQEGEGKAGFFQPKLPELAVQNVEEVVLNEIRQYLTSYYIEPVPPEVLAKKSPAEMLAALGDPYSQYLDAAAYRAFLESLEGKFGGIGIQVEKTEAGVTIVAPLPDTPGERAGLKAKDLITSVDGRPVGKMSVEEVVTLIRGEPNTTVTLGITRPGEKSFTVKLRREKIEIPTVIARREGEIGFLRLTSFNEQTEGKVREALARFQKEKVAGIVLDCRDNPGGLLSAAVQTAGIFTPGGTIVQIVNREGKREELRTAGERKRPPLVVLVNQGTASAAEILAGAIQDYGTGEIVGTPTFGKGSVQTLFPLSNNGFLKLTTAAYLTPHGQTVEKKGLSPDHYVSGPQNQLVYARGLCWEKAKQKGAEKQENVVVSFTAGKKTAVSGGEEILLKKPPFIWRGQTYLALEAFPAALGVFVDYGDEEIFFARGKARLKIKGERIVKENSSKRGEQARVLRRSREIYLPLRFVGEACGGKVTWEARAQKVTCIFKY